MRVAELHAPRDSFAIGDARWACHHLGRVFALHALDVDIEVELAHAGDDRLAALDVGADAERRVFLREAAAAPWTCWSEPCCPSASTVRLMTGSGTNIDVMATLSVPSVNVSPELQSMPNIAMMSPARRVVDVFHLVRVHANEAADLVALAGAACW